MSPLRFNNNMSGLSYQLDSLPVYFIIEAAPIIRGKPSCAATWPQSFASAETADSRQILDFQISDFRVGGQKWWYLYCPGPTLNLFSAVRGWRIRQITLLGDISQQQVCNATMVLGAELSVTEF